MGNVELEYVYVVGFEDQGIKAIPLLSLEDGGVYLVSFDQLDHIHCQVLVDHGSAGLHLKEEYASNKVRAKGEVIGTHRLTGCGSQSWPRLAASNHVSRLSSLLLLLLLLIPCRDCP